MSGQNPEQPEGLPTTDPGAVNPQSSTPADQPPAGEGGDAPDGTGPSTDDIDAALAAADDSAGDPHGAVQLIEDGHAQEGNEPFPVGLGGLSQEAPLPQAAGLPMSAIGVELPDFSQVAVPVESAGIELLSDVELNVKIELGRAEMLIEDVLRLGEGSVVELDKLAGDPVDVLVNDRLVARGEVLVLNESFCVRINEIVADIEQEAAA